MPLLTLRYSKARQAVLVAFAYDREVVQYLQRFPGARWLKSMKLWAIPATPVAVGSLIEDFDGHVRVDSESDALADEFRVLREPYLGPLPPKKIDGVKTLLWEHQRKAVQWLTTHPAALLDMEMGTGKSLTALAAMQHLGLKRVLILCPSSVLNVWNGQTGRHLERRGVCMVADRRHLVARRVKSIKQFMEHAPHLRIGVLNYESVPYMDSSLEHVPWDAIVADECHKLKAPTGRISKAVARFGLLAKRRWGMTGTPLPHGPMDIYGQYRFLDAGIFGTSVSKFRRRHLIMGGYGNYEVRGIQNEIDFQRRINLLRLHVGEEVLDLPKSLDIEMPVTLSSAEAKAYERMEASFVADVKSGVVVASTALVRMLMMQELTGGWIRDPDSGGLYQQGTAKAEVLSEILDGVNGKVVVFCRFRADLRAAEDAANQLGLPYGEISGKRKDISPTGTWPDGVEVLGVQIQSGGLGVDLSRAHHAVFYSLGFSLGDFRQARKRLDRPGQTQAVRFYHLVAVLPDGGQTIDAHVYEALRNRQAVVDRLLQTYKEA